MSELVSIGRRLLVKTTSRPSTPESALWLPIPDENDLSRVGIFLQHFQASFPPTSLPVTLADHTAVQGVEGGIEGLRDLGRRATPFQRP
jgi:hypothetical protein